MKKLYYIIVTIGLLVFVYWIISGLPSFSTRLFEMANHTIDSSRFSSAGSFKFKSTAERNKLILNMLEINTKFINSPPMSFSEDKNDIKYFYKIEPYFTSFKNYYIGKLKVQNVLTNEVPKLCKTTSNMTEKELEKYFNSNTKYLKEKLGITTFSDFNEFILTISELNGKEVASYELEESYFHFQKQGATHFRIIINTTDNKSVYLAVKAEIYNNTDYQTAPVIKFFGTVLGGLS